MINHETFNPLESYAFLQSDTSAVLIDVRMEIEFMYVGYPVGAIIPWYEYPDLRPTQINLCKQFLKKSVTIKPGQYYLSAAQRAAQSQLGKHWRVRAS